LVNRGCPLASDTAKISHRERGAEAAQYKGGRPLYTVSVAAKKARFCFPLGRRRERAEEWGPLMERNGVAVLLWTDDRTVARGGDATGRFVNMGIEKNVPGGKTREMSKDDGKPIRPEWYVHCSGYSGAGSR